jgi:transcription elongation GreA/GreB family factor
MNKRELVQQIIAKLKGDVAMFAQSAQATHEQATDSENRAEDKYDTRGLEASYLAMGQARQAEETALAVQAFEALSLRDFLPSDEISLGALVTVESRNRPAHYFIGPKAGGTELNHAGVEVMVITPQSPLGRQLMGKRQGDTFEMEIGGRKSASRIAKVG